MNLVIYGNKHYEDEKALVNVDKNEVILKGDYYHDKINDKIDAYLQALKDFNIYSFDTNEEWIDSKHELYNYLGFYNEEED